MVGIICPHVGIGLCWLPKLVWDQSDLLTLFLLGGADYAPTFLTPPPFRPFAIHRGVNDGWAEWAIAHPAIACRIKY